MPEHKTTYLRLLRMRLGEVEALANCDDFESCIMNYWEWCQQVKSHLSRLTGDEKLAEHWVDVTSLPEGIRDFGEDAWNYYRRRLAGAKAWLEAFIADTEVPAPEATPIAKPTKLEPQSVHTTARIFIGHGRSPVWRELKDFIQDNLHLNWEEFNRDAAAGLATTERISQMLESASFAFIVMTAEDKHIDGTEHARENVVHEAGLFQGRLGFRKAIILIEEGCEEFSNIKGLTQIRFPKGDILARSEEVRKVLQREGIQ